MFTKKWQNSTRDYGVVAESDVYISLSDGTNIDCDLFRPDAEGKFPAILTTSPGRQRLPWGGQELMLGNLDASSLTDEED